MTELENRVAELEVSCLATLTVLAQVAVELLSKLPRKDADESITVLHGVFDKPLEETDDQSLEGLRLRQLQREYWRQLRQSLRTRGL